MSSAEHEIAYTSCISLGSYGQYVGSSLYAHILYILIKSILLW